MAANLELGSGTGPCPEPPPDWEAWDHAAFADVLTDDPCWLSDPGDPPGFPPVDETRSLLDSDPESLTPPGVIDFLVEVQRAQSRLAALESRALVAAAGAHVRRRGVTIDEPGPDGDREVTIADEIREEVAAALHRSPGLVHDQIVMARLLAGALADTRNALEDGRISAQHARVIAEQARRLSPSHASCHQPPRDDTPAQAEERREFELACALLQHRVLPTAERTTPSKTRARARAVVAAIDTDAQEKRRQQAKALIDVQIYPDDDGLAILLARMPIEHAVRAHAALDARARTTRADCHATLGQLRVDALLAALCGPSTSATPTTMPAANVTTEIQIVIDAAVLSGSDDAGAIVVGHEGQQPISAAAVRALLADPHVPTSLRRLVTDPIDGHLLDRGRTSYRVTDAMRAFVAARDVTCRHPGCTRPASGCQVDHAVAWNDGGATDRANLGPLCTRHHQLKTHAEWQIVESRRDGSVVWRSPHGRRYEVDPPPVLPAKAPPPTTPPPANSGQAPPGSTDPPF